LIDFKLKMFKIVLTKRNNFIMKNLPKEKDCISEEDKSNGWEIVQKGVEYLIINGNLGKRKLSKIDNNISNMELQNDKNN